MSAIDISVDVLRDEIRKTYANVSTDREPEFIFSTGRHRRMSSTAPGRSRACSRRDRREFRRAGSHLTAGWGSRRGAAGSIL